MTTRTPTAAAAAARLLVWVAAACSGAPSSRLASVRASVVAVAELPPGTTLRLLAVEGSPPAAVPPRALDGLWREALRQSPHFDVAAGPVAGPEAALPALQLSIDDRALALTTTLLRAGEPPVHAAAASYESRTLAAALDDLALRTRVALGELPAADPVPVERAYTADLEAAAQCEEALARAQDGEFGRALRNLGAARRRDGGSPMLLEAIASISAMLGQTGHARQAADEALRLLHRLSPSTTHRLARTLLLARASEEPAAAGRYDRELLTLGLVAARERPFDPEPQLTLGVAHNFLGDFAAAAAVLRPLTQRLPQSASAHYHLGWAELALGEPRAALAAFALVTPVLPAGTTVVPRALALFQCGEHEQLRAFLAELADDPAVRGGAALHDVRRMQAAHALLCGRMQEAGDFVLQDLVWLAAQPARLRDHAGELAETGEVLVRLGRGQDIAGLLVSIQQLNLGPAIADATTYLQGLSESAERRGRVPAVEAGLRQRGATVWSYALAAFGHRQLGELGDENAALSQAAQQSSSPLVRAALVRNLRALGQADQADALRAAMRRESLVIDLRRRGQHPLFGPELAMAWLVD